MVFEGVTQLIIQTSPNDRLLDWTHSVEVRALARVLGRDAAVCVCCYRLVCETGASWEQMSDRMTVSIAGKAVGVSKDFFSFVVRASLLFSVHFHFTPSDSAFTLHSTSRFIFPSLPSLCVRPPSHEGYHRIC